MDFQEIIRFWYEEIDQKQWWEKDAAFDELIRERFGALHRKAALGELFAWRRAPLGRLAEIIILDQFSRNIFRDSARAFAYDGQALALSQEAVHSSADRELKPMEKSFLYMPMMHSESLLVHREALRLYSQPGLDYNLDFEKQHMAIIERFGRYPHRNALLGRESTPDETAFLQQPNSSF
ncbi:MAG: DUF924 family protein [Acidobacteriota bacterium]|nr:DUF924 family protein [Acidobacteriota bacterium]